jgi:hypothetical protein
MDGWTDGQTDTQVDSFPTHTHTHTHADKTRESGIILPLRKWQWTPYPIRGPCNTSHKMVSSVGGVWEKNWYLLAAIIPPRSVFVPGFLKLQLQMV